MFDCRARQITKRHGENRGEPDQQKLSELVPAKPTRNTRKTTAKAAAFGPTLKNAVTGAGAPESKHLASRFENGTADTLNARPTNTRIKATEVREDQSADRTRCAFKSERLVEPVIP